MSIDYGKLSDRELLLITVKSLNDVCERLKILNGKTELLDKRVDAVEMKMAVSNAESAFLNLNKKQTLGWGSMGIALVSIIVVILSKIVEVFW